MSTERIVSWNYVLRLHVGYYKCPYLVVILVPSWLSALSTHVCQIGAKPESLYYSLFLNYLCCKRKE